MLVQSPEITNVQKLETSPSWFFFLSTFKSYSHLKKACGLSLRFGFLILVMSGIQLQLNLAITDFKGLKIFICYRRISVIASMENKEYFSQGTIELPSFPSVIGGFPLFWIRYSGRQLYEKKERMKGRKYEEIHERIRNRC